ncbi:MAG: LAGLIDADG family homing endonuclease, partial [Euryarchaeota archaeon]|nr:LAGLIDADG family homing endonuclease [Euryarchaeota archaeon]
LRIPDSHKLTLNRRYNEISFPKHLNSDLGRLLGYVVSEGHVYYSEKTGVAEIMVSNTDQDIINDVDTLIRKTFDTTTYIQHQPPSVRKEATKDVYTVRCASILLYDYMKLNFMGVTVKSHEKRIPDPIFASTDNIRVEFLIGAFRGDGFYDSERFGYTTNSIGLANDYSDLLLCLGIYSYIIKSDEYWSNTEERMKTAYKVVISGYSSQEKFYDVIGKYDRRNERIKKFVVRSGNKLNDHDRVPVNVAIRITKLLKDYRLDDGYFYKIISNNSGIHRKVALKYLNRVESYLSDIQPHNIDEITDPRETRKKYRIPIQQIAERMGLSDSMVTYIERNPSTKNAPRLLEHIRYIAKAKLEATANTIKDIKKIVESDIRFVTVKSVSVVKNDGCDWVYDVTVEPDHTFVSNGLILHNTVSIAKAGIMATLKSRCSLLGAANPKYGRFDPYEGIAQQIQMAPALMSRFDLIFVLKDEPDIGRDTAIATHILGAHHAGELHAHKTHISGSGITDTDIKDAMEIINPKIMPDILRKYIAYAKKEVYPIMDDVARDQLIEFYLGLRRQGEDRDSPVPVTARQLEALVRLCEASARIRLSNEITTDDSQRVIRVVESCLRQVAFDAETGKFDVDILTTGVSKSQRDKIKTLRNIIREVEAEHSGMAPMEEVFTRAAEQGFEKEYVDELIKRLKTQGELYEPTPEHIRLTG